MKSLLITLQIEMLRERFRHDIHYYLTDNIPSLLDAKWHPEVGLCWPLTWLEHVDEFIQDRWRKFMEGQTFCEAGFYERDVRRFLFNLEW